MKGVFITGTDTDVGKTYVASLLVRRLREMGLRTGAYKPVCSGASTNLDGPPHWADVEALHAACEGEYPRDRICPQTFLAPLAPPVAAESEGRTVDYDLLAKGVNWWRDEVDALVIEGVGGLLCPLTDDTTVADFASELRCGLIIVAAQRLGTINHTLLTVHTAQSLGLPMMGVIMNEPTPMTDDENRQSNLAEITGRTEVPILATVEFAGDLRLRTPDGQGTIDVADWLTAM